jgi:hypothetical protein
MSSLDQFALTFACSYCSAHANQWCVTKSGKRSTYLHTDRVWLIQKVWSAGHVEGQDMAHRNLAGWLTKKREGYPWAHDAPLVGLDVIDFIEKHGKYWADRREEMGSDLP